MSKKFIIFFLISIILFVPFIFRAKIPSHAASGNITKSADDNTIIIITAHNDSLRSEYEIGFKKWYLAKTGKTVNIDWRHIGGGREIVMYIESVYSNNFKYYWTNTLKRQWDNNVAAAFANRHKSNQNNILCAEVKKEFLNSNVDCGIDIMFGGGMSEFILQASKGTLVTCPVLKEHPEMFSEITIPPIFAGDRLWDEEGRWFGASLTAFGIIYNADAIVAAKIKKFPETWMDLASPEYFQKLAIVDPTKSSSTLKAFGMLIQQQIEISLENSRKTKQNSKLSENEEFAAVSEGWLNSLHIIQKIVANGRYFTETGTKPITDISAGNCLAGIAPDFYGFSQANHIENISGSKRFNFIIPKGGGAPSPDPIGILRGAQHFDLASLFVEYILSLDGQKILGFKVGTPGGPEHVPMLRTPILKTVFEEKSFREYRSYPDINPYVSSQNFVSHEKWISPVFSSIGPIIKWAFIDLNDELRNAWREIINARNHGRATDAQHAEALFSVEDKFTYKKVLNEFANLSRDKDNLQIIKYQIKITNYFREKYLLAARIARGNIKK